MTGKATFLTQAGEIRYSLQGIQEEKSEIQEAEKEKRVTMICPHAYTLEVLIMIKMMRLELDVLIRA